MLDVIRPVRVHLVVVLLPTGQTGDVGKTRGIFGHHARKNPGGVCERAVVRQFRHRRLRRFGPDGRGGGLLARQDRESDDEENECKANTGEEMEHGVLLS
jgi:hypothetical protein